MTKFSLAQQWHGWGFFNGTRFKKLGGGVEKMNSIKIAKRVSMVLMVSTLVAMFSIAFITTVSAETGNTNAQEVGDAIYRHLSILGIDEAHAGIYYRYLCGDPSDRHNHEVIEMHKVRLGVYRVEITKMDDFIASRTYYGAHTVSPDGKLKFSTRQKIINTALDMVNRDPPIGYPVPPFMDILEPDWDGDCWDGTVDDIKNIRCDGVVEYSYEANGVMVWGKNQQAGHYDITQLVTRANYGKGWNLYEHNDLTVPGIDPADELTPNVQRGALGLQYTNMRASSPENPTNVSNLHSTSHNNAIGQWNNPQSRDNTIEVAWTDATDFQSGLWGYYVKWDNQPDTEPTWEDTKIDPDVETATSPELEDGDDWYFHIRSVDNAGNMNDSTAHLGPFYIDTTPPIAVASPSFQTVDVGEPASFDGSGSYDPDSSGIDRYEWDFGDGYTGSGVTTSHAYGSVGTYTVTLRVWDRAGNDGTGTAQTQVGVEVIPEFSTIAIPVVTILGLLFLISRRKQKR
jgi:hypothetical protein